MHSSIQKLQRVLPEYTQKEVALGFLTSSDSFCLLSHDQSCPHPHKYASA